MKMLEKENNIYSECPHVIFSQPPWELGFIIPVFPKMKPKDQKKKKLKTLKSAATEWLAWNLKANV